MRILSAVAFFLMGLVGALGLVGCAYTTKNTLPGHIKTLEVNTFDNSTYYNGLESILTRDVIRCINLTPGLKVVNSGGDATLSGEITKVQRITTAWDSNDQPTTQQITVTVRIQLYDNRSNEFVYSDMNLVNTQGSSNAGLLHVDDGQQWTSARNAALEELAKQIVRNLNSKW